MRENSGKLFFPVRLPEISVESHVCLSDQESTIISKIVFVSLWFLVLMIPLENMVVIEGVGTISRFIGAFCIVMAMVAVLAEKRGRPLGAMQSAFGIFVLWNMATFFWTVDHEKSRIAILSMAQLFAFVWLIWEFCRDEIRQLWLMQAYVCGAMASALMTFSAFWQNDATSYLRYSTPGFDPNDLGLMLALAVPMAWYLAIKEKNFWLRQIYRLYLPVSFLAVLLTASRMSFIALLIAYFFVVWSFQRLPALHRFFIFGGFGAACWGLMHVIPQSSWMRLATISQEVGAGTLGGRVGIWKDGLLIFRDHPWFGIGAGAFRTGLLEMQGYEASPHNLFLSILVSQGLIGLLLFLLILVCAIRGLAGMYSLLCRMWLVVVLTWGVGVMTLGWEGRKPTWLILGLLAAMGAVGRRAETEPDRKMSL
jgi:O-antigen ligase